MAQSWTDDCFAADHQGLTDLQNMENNMQCLKTCFSGDSAPSNPAAGQWWYDTANKILKIRNEANSAWLEVYDFANQRVAAGKVMTASLADGVLSADTAGRAKMADLYITNAKVNDINGSKIADTSIATAKLQNNTVTPAKLAAGASTLISWQSFQTMEGTPLPVIEAVTSGGPAHYTLIQNLAMDGSTYRPFMGWYVYIPSGAKYLVLGIRGGTSGATFYVRMNVNGTAGGAASVAGTTITNGNGSALDISAQAGAWRYLYLEGVLSGSAVARLQSVIIQWYGA